MAKLIKLTDDVKQGVIKEFSDALNKLKLSDGSLTFKKDVGSVARKATLYFTEIAYLKMLSLVKEFDKEVAWHGLAKRGEDPEKDEYIIYDIIVYAQDVTSTNVQTEQQEYQTWLMEQPDDVFNNIRMQGHSHVNMGVTPSGVDNNLYDGILGQLEDDMFYIFLIWNKRNDKYIKIYDMSKNICFDTNDVTVSLFDDNIGIEKFLKEAKELVRDKRITTPIGTYKYNTGFYYGGQTSQSPVPTTPVTTTPPVQTKVVSPTSDPEPLKKGADYSSSKKKRKKKSKNETSKVNGSVYPVDYYYGDDAYDAYGVNEDYKGY